MAVGTLAPAIVFTGLDNDGNPLSGGLLYTYAAGTTTPLATYSDLALTIPNANPIVLNAAGRPSSLGSEVSIYLLSASYKFVLKTSLGVTLWTRDNVGAIPATNIDNDVDGTAGEALTAGQVCYLDTTTWKKADADVAASSTLPPIAFAVGAVASAASGTFRLSGRMTGLSGLTPGADYYVSATAGEITATPPGNARYVGRADSITSLIITPNPRPASQPTPPDGRLTLTTNLPVTSADVTAATTLYFSPYGGNSLALYDGTKWNKYAFAQLSIAVPATTSQMYDVFVYDNAGVLTLELTAWTNDTTRATALTTQNGVYVRTGALTRLYLGSFRTTGVSGQTEDSAMKRYLWNYYNRVPRLLLQQETTSTWTYTTATWRQQRATATNQVEIVTGIGESPLTLSNRVLVSNDTGGVVLNVGIGEDSTTAPVSAAAVGSALTPAGIFTTISANLWKIPAVGYHRYVALEASTAVGTSTWVGASGSAAATTGANGTGMFGTIEG